MTKQYLLNIFIIISAALVASVYSTTSAIPTTQPVVLVGENNNVKVHFMDLKKEEFVEALPNVKDAVSDLFNKFCMDEDANCEDLRSVNFTRDNVDVIGQTDKDKYTEDGRYVIVKLLMKYFNKDNETSYIPQGLLKGFLKKSRDALVKASKVDIAFIQDEFVYPMRNNLDNYIIIPISLAVMLILVILNCVCQRKREKEILEELSNKKPIHKSRDSVKNKTEDIELTEENENDNNRYLEPEPKFPLPEERPMIYSRDVKYTAV